MSNKPTIIEALVLETKAGLLNSQTGDEQSLTKVVTLQGNIVTLWHADNKIHAVTGEEVYLLGEPSTTLKDDGTPFINYAILPEAFVNKMKESHGGEV